MSAPDADAPPRGGLPRLHLVTDDSILASRGWLATACEVLEAGGAGLALHLRGPNTPPRTLLELADELLSTSRPLGATLLVNDRVDVALVTDCDGAHLGGGSLPAAAVRLLVGPERWVGVSCHDLGEVDAAARSGADYGFVGTIHPTASHPGRTGMGPSGLADIVARTAGLPLMGIGGIGPDEVEAVLHAGAHGVATIRGVWAAADPAAAVTRYLEALGI